MNESSLTSPENTSVTPLLKKNNSRKYFILIIILVAFIGGILLLKSLGNKSAIVSHLPFLTNTEWNTAKATYLAKRVYLDPTTQDVAALSSASSPQDAVNRLFSQPSPQEIEQFQKELQNLIQKKDTYKNQTVFEDTVYMYQLIHDPDRVRRKLYYLWENIFSVDAPEKGKMITLDDAKALHQILYDNAFGNYIQIVKTVETNYAMAQYLDLTASSSKNPNENFARELMQLFLIGQYTPVDTNHTTLNYTDQDVNSLAYILTGFTADKGNHTITFSPGRHSADTKSFLGEQYNDPQNAIDFIVQKKRTEAGEFLANKILKYYVTDSPSNNDISAFSDIILKNNFEITASLKWLFASDMMYSTSYMQEDRYKTPMELIASFYTQLYGRNNYQILPVASELTDLDFKPFNPGSIFGRDGFNNNILFYSGTIMNRWIADTDRLLHAIPQKNITSIVNTILPNSENIQSPDQLIQAFEGKLYLGNSLPQDVKDSLKNYLITDDSGKSIPFSYADPAFKAQKLPGLLSFMLVQPEFLMQSGNLQATHLTSIKQTSGTNTNKLIIVRVRGGWDFQGIWANASDPLYASNRKQMALNTTNSSVLGNGYRLSNAASSLLPLLQSKEAFLVSSVGLPNHSRAHDIAGIEMETGDSQNQEGILGKLAKEVPDTNLISFTNTPPLMLKGSQSLQIGSSSLSLYQIGKKKNASAQTITIRESDLKQIFTNRLFPVAIAPYYTQALLLDTLANEDIAQGGKGTAGNNNASQLPFLKKLIGNNIGNTYYLYADNSYDHHAHEDLLFDKEISTLFSDFANFYNDEKSKEKLTIVFFSEFGRTDKSNGSNGTDHGQGGGMVVVSNVIHWPTMIGTISPSQDTHNWTTVQVDERDVWDSLFNNLYGLPQDTLFGRSTMLTSYPIGVK